MYSSALVTATLARNDSGWTTLIDLHESFRNRHYSNCLKQLVKRAENTIQKPCNFQYNQKNNCVLQICSFTKHIHNNS